MKGRGWEGTLCPLTLNDCQDLKAVRLVETVDYFPTLDTLNLDHGFLISDLASLVRSAPIATGSGRRLSLPAPKHQNQKIGDVKIK